MINRPIIQTIALLWLGKKNKLNKVSTVCIIKSKSTPTVS
jgi:hypothetical protein